jgi:hypothetical protein
MVADWLKADGYTEPNGILNNFDFNSNSGWQTSGCKFGNCLKFDGVDDWVDIDDLALPEFHDKTVAFWLKRNGAPATGNTWYVLGTANQWRAQVKIDENGQVFMVVGGSTAGAGNTFIADSTWAHIALSMTEPSSHDIDGQTQCYFYVGGVNQGNPSVDGYHYRDLLEGVCIGALNDGLQEFGKFTIDDFRIYDTVLSDSDIALLADNDSGTNPAATPIIKYDFDESSGNTAHNSGFLTSVYHPLESEANIYDEEPQGSKTVNFADFAILAEYWLYETPNWPKQLTPIS